MTALRLAAGRARAAELMPYLATALFAMTPVEAPGLGTLGVDRRWRLYWDPAVVASLSVAECAGAWLHEVGHLLREHADRWTALAEPDRRHPAWNAAGDAAINADLRDARVVLPGAHAWYPERIPGADRSMTTEQLYRLLRDHPDPAGGAAPEQVLVDCGSGAGGARRPWERPDDAAGDAAGDEDGVAGDGSVDAGRAALLRQRVARDTAEHARRGGVPQGWARWADRTLHPQVDWRAELHSVVRRASATVAGLRDHTYARPSRRAAAVPGVVLPALRQPRPPVVRVVVDTSGSMSPAMLGQCLAEVGAIVARVSRGGSAVEVIACDASAADVQAVRAASRVTLTGGGGTDLRVGLAAAAARRPRPDLVVVLTDGETPWPAGPPPEAPRARYVAVLVAGADAARGVPAWMHTVLVRPEDLPAP